MPIRSAPRSSEGPAVVTMAAPISLAMMVASVVLPSPGRPRQQHVVERLAALARRLDRHAQALHGRPLADVFVEALRTQLALDLRLLRQRHPAHHPRFVIHRLRLLPR